MDALDWIGVLFVAVIAVCIYLAGFQHGHIRTCEMRDRLDRKYPPRF